MNKALLINEKRDLINKNIVVEQDLQMFPCLETRKGENWEDQKRSRIAEWRNSISAENEMEKKGIYLQRLIAEIVPLYD